LLTSNEMSVIYWLLLSQWKLNDSLCVVSIVFYTLQKTSATIFSSHMIASVASVLQVHVPALLMLLIVECSKAWNSCNFQCRDFSTRFHVNQPGNTDTHSHHGDLM